MTKPSVFRFLSSNRSGQYSVQRRDQHIGYVTKDVSRLNDMGVNRTIVSGWRPSTADRIDLALAPTRAAAAKALWAYVQERAAQESLR